jgi:acetyl-CoA carboxylase biotin carboxyl carrier protein
MDLTEDDVREILKLFEQSKFDYMHLEQGELKMTVSKNGYNPAAAAQAPAATLPPTAAVRTAVPTAAPAPAAAPAAAPVEAVDAGLIPVTAPMVGTFYAAPSPQDPPYVTEGAKVAVGAALGLIEVMKVFTGVKTEVAGTVEKIVVKNAQAVEFGQTLFLIRPDK